MKLILVMLLSIILVDHAKGESEVIGSHDPIKVVVGDDAILLCHVNPAKDVRSLTVEWKHDKTIVHVYRNRKDDPDPQDQKFEGRTSLFHDEMANGNISLKLTNVTENDAGNYTCIIPSPQMRKGNVTLIVGRNVGAGDGIGIWIILIVIVIVIVIAIVIGQMHSFSIKVQWRREFIEVGEG